MIFISKSITVSNDDKKSLNANGKSIFGILMGNLELDLIIFSKYILGNMGGESYSLKLNKLKKAEAKNTPIVIKKFTTLIFLFKTNGTKLNTAKNMLPS